ncbi:MAG: beta-ketoacyl-ACP reductase [Acidimicrobiia bacterium]|nr:MAG: beta-ketoacyl-ACP reductase [Acidimicrobiia bacterium]
MMNNEVTIVTGAGAGIGRRIAEVMAARGSSVALLDINRDQLDEVASEIEGAGGTALPLMTDVTKSAEVKGAVDRVLERWGRIDVLVNNAGILRVGTVTEGSEEDWDLVLEVNLKGVYLCSRHVLPSMIDAGSGSIVNIASVAAASANPDLAAYSASKAGVVNLSRAMAKGYGPLGIRVNCVLPGTIPTDMHRIFYNEDDADETLATWALNKPLRRNGTTDDIASAVAFLASDEANFITGVVLPIDGGATL